MDEDEAPTYTEQWDEMCENYTPPNDDYEPIAEDEDNE